MFNVGTFKHVHDLSNFQDNECIEKGFKNESQEYKKNKTKQKM